MITQKLENQDIIDDLKNKKVIEVGEHIQYLTKITINDLRKNIQNKLKLIQSEIEKEKKYNEKIYINLIDKHIINNNIKNFFNINPLSQILDELNPLSEITQKRKLTLTGKQGVSQKNASIEMREINKSQFGKICPIETSEGKNAGLILSLSKNSKINKNGFIETPFFLRF